ncbi:hypothetical protein ON010_g10961 [Phytophthora cinnamomi]|nr:hypothetical protein ON010_g10961 [Phytophthora cinnamomi]
MPTTLGADPGSTGVASGAGSGKAGGGGPAEGTYVVGIVGPAFAPAGGGGRSGCRRSSGISRTPRSLRPQALGKRPRNQFADPGTIWLLGLESCLAAY